MVCSDKSNRRLGDEENGLLTPTLHFAPVLGFNAWLGVFIESGCQGEHINERRFFIV